jgi:hypothetical protein
VGFLSAVGDSTKISLMMMMKQYYFNTENKNVCITPRTKAIIIINKTLINTLEKLMNIKCNMRI